MTESEARVVYEQFCDRHGLNKAIPATPYPDGSWLFIERGGDAPDGEYVGVIVRADTGKAFGFFGALGKVFRNCPPLGAPTSNELVLGATEFGRYQTFDHGIAVWDGGIGIGFPLIESLIQGCRQTCIVAFFDLRGFTSWSRQSETRPDDVQTAIRGFERAVHTAFPTHATIWLKLFVKGTGDGVMIVSQADWYAGDTPNAKSPGFKAGHAKDFLLACARTLSEGREHLKDFPLAIGCAIGAGQLDRVFLFGRLDYIGSVANDVAKLQQHAWNEVCVTDEFREMLIGDGETIDGAVELPPKRWRLRSA